MTPPLTIGIMTIPRVAVCVTGCDHTTEKRPDTLPGASSPGFRIPQRDFTAYSGFQRVSQQPEFTVVTADSHWTALVGHKFGDGRTTTSSAAEILK